jgi:hypothetical protein
MKKQMRAALAVIFMLVCTIAQATNLDIKIQSTYASEWSSYLNNTYDIKFTDRIFTANAWDGICLPFDMNETQLINTFGENGYEIRSFKEMSGNKFVFENASTITHGVPYLIKIKNGIAEDGTVRFKGVTIASSVTDDYIKVEPTPGLQFRGFYFRKYGAALVDNQSGHAQYTIKSDGTLEKDHWYDDPGCIGPYAYFFVNDASAVTTIGVEGAFTGGGSESGEGGDDPAPTTLDGKIAARAQLTNLPTIYLDIDMPEGETLNTYLYKNRATNEAPYRYSKIKVVATSDTSSPDYLESFEESDIDEAGVTNLQIKVRGNSTASVGNGKRPYRLKFAKGHKHDLINGGYSKRNWTLLANAYDRSLMRNALAYHIGQYVGMDFCPGYKFVDLVINNEYRGTYQVSDQVEAGKNRVDIDEDNDWMMEFATWANMTEEPCITSNISYMTSIKNPDADDLTEEQLTTLKADVKAWVNQLGAAWDNNSNTSGWPAYNDIESLVKFYIGINLTGDYDGFFVVKGYRPLGGKQFWGPLWDKDLSFNNCSELSSDKEKQLVENYNYGTFAQTFQKLHSNYLFISKAKELIDRLVDEELASKLAQHIDAMADDLNQSQALNYEKYSITATLGLETQNKSTDYSTYPAQLKTYMEERIPLVQEAITALYNEAKKAKITANYYPDNYWYGTGVYDYKNKLADVTVRNRTLKAGTWNTFCVPFDATETQMKAALGCDYELRTHSGMDTDGKTMLFETPATKDIAAGYPYLIKLTGTSDVSNMTFSDVMIVEDANQDTKYNGQCVTFDNEHYFYGTLFTTANNNTNLNKNTDYVFTNDVYAENDVLTKVSSDIIAGARAFIRVPEGETAAIKMGEVVIEDLVFDVNNGSVSADKLNGTYNIQLKNRGLLYADGWCTITLPFTITKKNFEAAIGYETKLRELSSIKGTSFEFGKVADKTMHAGVPYLIMIDNTDTSITKDLGTVVFNNTKMEATEGTRVSPKEDYAFVGILEAKQLAKDGTELFMGANSELYKPSSTSGKLGGGRAYFKIPSKASTSGAKISVMIDGIVTSIEEQIKNAVEPKDSRVFNLNGQKINSSNLQSLPRGIYISNGKKVMK